MADKINKQTLRAFVDHMSKIPKICVSFCKLTDRKIWLAANKNFTCRVSIDESFIPQI
jgi:hypothetical protein